MYRVTINRETLRNHIHYDWWQYVVGIVLTVFVWSMVTAMTRTQTPPDKKVDIFLVGDYVFDEAVEPLAEKIRADFPELLEVNINNIPLGGDPQLDYVGRQKLMVMVGSQTGDIFVFDKEDFEAFAKQGAFVPLDDYIDDELKRYIPSDKLVRMKAEEIEEETEPHFYGIKLDDVSIFEGTGYNVKDKVIGVMAYSKNKEKAIEVLKWIVTDGKIKR